MAQTELMALRLCGSEARGQNDRESDRDILAIVCSNSRGMHRYLCVTLADQTTDDVSVYTEDQYRKMHAAGHLFTWHIFLESQLYATPSLGLAVRSPDIIQQLGQPAEYTNARQDTLALKAVFDDMLDSITSGDPHVSTAFEAGILYVVCRNLSIISRHHAQPDFSVMAPYNVEWRNMGIRDFPLPENAYMALRSCRKLSTHGQSCPVPPISTIHQYASDVFPWIDDVVTYFANEDWTEKCQ